MKSASIQEIKKELLQLTQPQLVEYCLRLAKYKKENKELLNYLLFEATAAQDYIEAVKVEIDSLFTTINYKQVFFAKKTLRKIVRFCTKCIKQTGTKEAEIEILAHFCICLKKSPLPIASYPVLFNMQQAQLKKITNSIQSLHPDLQYDYLKLIDF
jgi:hypothetical protein